MSKERNPEKEFEKLAGKFLAVKMTRRKFLAHTALMVSTTALAGISLAEGVREERIKSDVAAPITEKYNPLIAQAKDESKQLGQLKKAAIEKIQQGNTSDAQRIINSEEFRDASLKDIKREALSQELDEKLTSAFSKEIILPTGTALSIFAFSSMGAIFSFLLSFFPREELKAKYKVDKERAKRRILRFKSSWKDNSPTKKEFEEFDRIISYLPPIGGKIVLEDGSAPNLEEMVHYGAFYPAQTAEELSETVIKARREGKLGEHYVNQISVQGRLPDNFKYAALALIAQNPIISDWDEPFFEADWGKVAPLIHDGGVTDTKVNPLWKMQGRTDFLSREFFVRSNLEEKPKKNKKKPLDKISDGLNDRAEEERIRLEDKFYQRAAFALSCYSSRAPKKIPFEIRNQAANIWNDFQSTMDRFLLNTGVIDPQKGDVIWFHEKPREIESLRYGLRHEAEWEPIKEQIQRLEQVKISNPQVIEQMALLMTNLVNKIDRAIGLA